MRFNLIYLAALGLITVATISLSACLRIENTFSKIPPGPWRVVLQLEPSMITPNPKGKPLDEKLNLTFDEVSNGELPFTMEVSYTDDTTFQVELINGTERILVPSANIRFGHTRDDIKDTIRIDFPVFDTYLIGRYENGLIEGDWIVNYKEEYRIPFVARYGQDHRFTKMQKAPIADISGKWKVMFGVESEDETPYPAIGEFIQDSTQVTGTFRTETGDYRYLEGTIQGNKLYLSVFDGAHAFLFEAKISENGDDMLGSFRSGTHYQTLWTATRDESAELPDPKSLTTVVGPDKKFNFTFPNIKGEAVSLSDKAFDGKVKLVQIMGTWCPNCKDETLFLLKYLQENAHPDLQLITVGFERYRESEKALAALTRFQENFKIPYPVLWGGYYNKAEAAEAFPMLNHILSYPTLLFVDRANNLQYIHTGFNGPATSQYADFEGWFRQTVAQMLADTDPAID